MSVNIRIDINIKGLASRDQAEEVQQSVREAVERENLHRDVAVWITESEGNFLVEGGTDGAIVISGYGPWERRFRGAIEAAVEQVAPQANTWVLCADVDLEREIKELRSM